MSTTTVMTQPASTASSTVTTTSSSPPDVPSVRPPVLTAVAFSDESGVPDRVVAIDAESGAVLRELYRVGDGPKRGQRGVRFTPDTSVLDLTVESGVVWFVETGVYCGVGTVYRVSLAGGPAEVVLEGARWPTPSPDGQLLAYVRGSPNGSISCAGEIVVRDLRTGEERVFSPPPGASDEFAVAHLAWASDSRQLAYAVVLEQRSVAVLDTATAASQANARTVDAGREGFPGCLTSPTWGPAGSLLMLGVEPLENCGPGGGDGTAVVSLVAFDVDTAGIERRHVVPQIGDLRADASGQHLLLSQYDLGTVELRADGTTRRISPDTLQADW